MIVELKKSKKVKYPRGGHVPRRIQRDEVSFRFIYEGQEATEEYAEFRQKEVQEPVVQEFTVGGKKLVFEEDQSAKFEGKTRERALKIATLTAELPHSRKKHPLNAFTQFIGDEDDAGVLTESNAEILYINPRSSTAQVRLLFILMADGDIPYAYAERNLLKNGEGSAWEVVKRLRSGNLKDRKSKWLDNFLENIPVNLDKSLKALHKNLQEWRGNADEISSIDIAHLAKLWEEGGVNESKDESEDETKVAA